MQQITRRVMLSGGAASVVIGGAAEAQAFPVGPVKVVTAVGPGAAPDVLTRIITHRLGQLWGQQVVVLNQPGGAGAVAIKATAMAPPDGHTFYMALASNFIALPDLQKNFPVDILRDFVPIGFIGEQPIGIGVVRSLGVNSLGEFIALLKSRPGDLNIAAGNRGSILHLTGEWFQSASQTRFAMLHYAGNSQIVMDLLGGRLQATIDPLASMRGTVDSGHVKLLATTSRIRLENFPNVPTVAETIPNFEASGWMVLMGPASTPAPSVRKLSDDLRTVLADPDVQKRCQELGSYPRPITPDELAAFIRSQVQTWAPVIAEATKTLR